MQLVRQEDTNIDFVQLMTPLIFISLPVVAVVGSIAVVFEAIPWLRRGLGNVVYFFLWIGALSTRLGGGGDNALHAQSNDLFGLGVIMPALASGVRSRLPGFHGRQGKFQSGNQYQELRSILGPDDFSVGRSKLDRRNDSRPAFVAGVCVWVWPCWPRFSFGASIPREKVPGERPRSLSRRPNPRRSKTALFLNVSPLAPSIH